MKSAIPKVMHPVAGQPMIAHLLDALRPLMPAATVVVIGPRMDAVAKTVASAETAIQDPPLGTGDAVRVALNLLDGRLAPQGDIENILVLYGDTPLLQGETLARLLAEQDRAPAAILLARPDPILTVGALVARSLYGAVCPIVVCAIDGVVSGDSVRIKATSAELAELRISSS